MTKFYVNFDGRDKRYDRWVVAGELERSADQKSSEKQASEQNKEDNAESGSKLPPAILTRNQRRIQQKQQNQNSARSTDEQNKTGEVQPFLSPEEAEFERQHQLTTKIKYIEQIEIAGCTIDTWYYSPYPFEYEKQPKLYICRFCLKYMRQAKTLKHHEETSCKWQTPPGKLIYEDKKYSDGTFKGVSAYMIDGREDKLYC